MTKTYKFDNSTWQFTDETLEDISRIPFSSGSMHSKICSLHQVLWGLDEDVEVDIEDMDRYDLPAGVLKSIAAYGKKNNLTIKEAVAKLAYQYGGWKWRQEILPVATLWRLPQTWPRSAFRDEIIEKADPKGGQTYRWDWCSVEDDAIPHITDMYELHILANQGTIHTRPVPTDIKATAEQLIDAGILKWHRNAYTCNA